VSLDNSTLQISGVVKRGGVSYTETFTYSKK
jgi:hypothetical protein